MGIVNDDTNSEDSDYSYYSGSSTESLLYGYSDRPRRKAHNYVSMDKLKLDYNINMEMEKKISLFLQAVEDEDLAFMERLLFDGIAVDCIGRDGWTALMKACLNGKDNVVEYLLQQGASVHFEADSFTPLLASCIKSFATEDKKLACVELLLRYNVKINKCDKHKTTALMYASSGGYLSIVNRLLLERGLNAHARDSEGWNAIFYAVSNNRVAVVEKLIEHGLDYDLEDGVGRTPANLAMERCYKKLVEILTGVTEEEIMAEWEKTHKDGYNMWLEYLKELPNEDGEGGFDSDTKSFLAEFGYNCEGNISFPDFLTMKEADLAKAGVKLRLNRRMIMHKGIHRYHLWPWNKYSMVPVLFTSEWLICDLIGIMASTVKHLTLMKSSLRYLATRIQNRRNKGNLGLEKETINALISCYTTNELLHERLQRILKLRYKVKDSKHGDFIVSKGLKKQKSTQSKMRPVLKYGLIVLGASTAGYLMFRMRLKVGC